MPAPAVGDLITFNSASGNWQSYAPVLSSTGTAPTVGTGNVSGMYYVNNGTLFFQIYVGFGTSPTAGTGRFVLSVPVNVDLSIAPPIVDAFLNKTATGVGYSYTGIFSNATQMTFYRGDATVSTWGSANPAAPASGDIFYVTGAVKAA